VARLIPQDGKFFDLFKADADNLAAAAGQLADMLEQFDQLDQRVNSIQALEKKGDHFTEQIGERLADAFVVPFDREDIYELAARFDDVVDYIQAVAETVVIYGVERPTPESRRLAQILAEQGDELAKAMASLQSRKGVAESLERVHDLEHEADGLSRAAIGRLFKERQDPLDVIKWRDLYHALENGSDAAEDAAEAVERMLHKAN
jgi:predicted phosphate transport protein (TIGR00153 family)